MMFLKEYRTHAEFERDLRSAPTYPLAFDPEFDNHYPDCADEQPADGPYLDHHACGCADRKSREHPEWMQGTEALARVEDEAPLPDPVTYVAGVLAGRTKPL